MSDEVLWSADEVREVLSAEISGIWNATGVSIDSRTIEKGDLFIAIVGDNFDGHKFVKDAVEAGAAACVVDRKVEGVNNDALCIVDDTFKALERLGVASRKRMRGKVVAVTGSVGKTSTKNMLKACFSSLGSVYATEGNYNNHFGVPLSLSRMQKDTDFGIFELGMNHAGEIHSLSEMVCPDVAIITTVDAVHLEYFDSVRAIADAKAEIFDGFVDGGVAVLNYDNSYYQHLKQVAIEKSISKVISVGEHEKSDVRLLSYELVDEGAHFSVEYKGDVLDYVIGITNIQQAKNSLFVLASVMALGEDVDGAVSAMHMFSEDAGRGKRHKLNRRGTDIELIDDSYNASPASVAASIETLTLCKKRKGGRAIAVLGDMYELGTEEKAMHVSLLDKIVENDVDLVFAAGKLMKHLYDVLPADRQGAWAEHSQDLAPLVADVLEEHDIVLVKGSHGIRMDNVVNYFLKE